MYDITANPVYRKVYFATCAVCGAEINKILGDEHYVMLSRDGVDYDECPTICRVCNQNKPEGVRTYNATWDRR